MQNIDEANSSLEILLANAFKKLQVCQQEKEISSCIACSNILGCAIRKEYVDAVYTSMNKGETGNFEF